MDDIDQWLKKVYQAGGDQRTLDRVYDQWAQHYDRHLWAIGNPFVAIAAGMTGRWIDDCSATILDAGCGTGNLGQILHQVGYQNLDGLDPSTGMLEIAKRKQIFRHLYQLALGAGVDLPSEKYDAVISTGVLTSGHALPGALDDLLTLVKVSGVLIFSLSKLAKDELGFGEKMAAFSRNKQWQALERSRLFRAHPFSESEAHVKLRVYVFRKL